MDLPYTQRLKRYWRDSGNNDPTPSEDDVADALQESGVDDEAAERLASMIEDGFKHSRNVGHREAQLGEDQDDSTLVYAVLATAAFSLINAIMIYQAHFKGALM